MIFHIFLSRCINYDVFLSKKYIKSDSNWFNSYGNMLIALIDVQRQGSLIQLHFSVTLPSVCGGVSLRLASLVVKMAVDVLGFAPSHTKSTGREGTSHGERGGCTVKTRVTFSPEVPRKPSLKLRWPYLAGSQPIPDSVAGLCHVLVAFVLSSLRWGEMGLSW